MSSLGVEGFMIQDLGFFGLSAPFAKLANVEAFALPTLPKPNSKRQKWELSGEALRP